MPRLPINPFDGQEFIDAFRIKWVYSAKDAAWNKIGIALDVPVARPEEHPDGPTNGLMSSRNKVLLDSISDKAGGFGIILKPGMYLTEDNAADNVLTGEVNILSESLEFKCDRTFDEFGCEDFRTLTVGLSEKFLDTYKLEIKGPAGPRGDKGPKGRPGRPGTGDGPKGDSGEDGQDALELHGFTGIIYEELDEVHNSAVVSLRLDAPAGILEVTKALIDVPDNDKPATRVAATPVLRTVEFTSNNLDDWQLTAPSDDPAEDVNLNMVRLPKGWVGDSDSVVPVIPIRLTDIIQVLIDYYIDLGNKQIGIWDKQLKDWAVGLDKAARGVLHDLGTQLAQCQFELPLEFCIGVEPCD